MCGLVSVLAAFFRVLTFAPQSTRKPSCNAVSDVSMSGLPKRPLSVLVSTQKYFIGLKRVLGSVLTFNVESARKRLYNAVNNGVTRGLTSVLVGVLPTFPCVGFRVVKYL